MASVAPSLQHQLGGFLSHLEATVASIQPTVTRRAHFSFAHITRRSRPSLKTTCSSRSSHPAQKVFQLLPEAGLQKPTKRKAQTPSASRKMGGAELEDSVLESEPFKREVLALVQEDDLRSILKEVQETFDIDCTVDAHALVKAAHKAIQHDYLEKSGSEDVEAPIADSLVQVGVDEILATLMELGLDRYLLEKEKAIVQIFKRS
ncbi:hypothetical protein KFL_000480360 [Klebsormidium nitens]|uniref:Uncharacterized protein n=1 Tax=Klebsormidium nitens TaxID=105231 RepID=A0A1Y1HNH3_KLENI|nr:hypothetical protein KFL_000480360 [Klebsormidium nitens]|eukprot:GAQ80195.1 hypothetical protein KFL_000480360 [Klebsormidium nitens]